MAARVRSEDAETAAARELPVGGVARGISIGALAAAEPEGESDCFAIGIETGCTKLDFSGGAVAEAAGDFGIRVGCDGDGGTLSAEAFS